MNISRELIEAYFCRIGGKIETTIPLFNKLEETLHDVGFEVHYPGVMPWFIIRENNITLLIIVIDKEETEYEVEIRIDLLGNIYWFQIDNLRGLYQEFEVGR